METTLQLSWQHLVELVRIQEQVHLLFQQEITIIQLAM